LLQCHEFVNNVNEFFNNHKNCATLSHVIVLQVVQFENVWAQDPEMQADEVELAVVVAECSFENNFANIYTRK